MMLQSGEIVTIPSNMGGSFDVRLVEPINGSPLHWKAVVVKNSEFVGMATAAWASQMHKPGSLPRQLLERRLGSCATDGRCHNAQTGCYGHECGKPATWLGVKGNGFVSGFCNSCKDHGDERHPFVEWHKLPETPYARLVAAGEALLARSRSDGTLDERIASYHAAVLAEEGPLTYLASQAVDAHGQSVYSQNVLATINRAKAAK